MNYTVAETYELPSNGKVYVDKKVNPCIKLQSMTTTHEMARLNHSDRPMKVMADIIDDCMVEPCGISSYDMCIPDYQFLLHKSRVVTYGPEYKVVNTCPLCGQQTHRSINLDAIPVKKYEESMIRYLSFELPRSKDRVTLNMATPRIMDNIQIRSKERKKQMPTYKGDFEFLMMLIEFISTVNGEEMDEFALEDYIRNLPMMDSNYIVNMSNEFTKSFGLITDEDLICENCGLSYKSPFRITGEFYRPGL